MAFKTLMTHFFQPLHELQIFSIEWKSDCRQDKLQARGTHVPTHGLASVSRVRTAISPWQWQPWTDVSPLLELINTAMPC